MAANAPAWPYSLTISQRKQTQIQREREIQIQNKNFHLLLAANAPAWPYFLTLSQRKQTQIQREREIQIQEKNNPLLLLAADAPAWPYFPDSLPPHFCPHRHTYSWFHILHNKILCMYVYVYLSLNFCLYFFGNVPSPNSLKPDTQTQVKNNNHHFYSAQNKSAPIPPPYLCYVCIGEYSASW